MQGRTSRRSRQINLDTSRNQFDKEFLANNEKNNFILQQHSSLTDFERMTEHPVNNCNDDVTIAPDADATWIIANPTLSSLFKKSVSSSWLRSKLSAASKCPACSHSRLLSVSQLKRYQSSQSLLLPLLMRKLRSQSQGEGPVVLQVDHLGEVRTFCT